jgi:hypothetical protein
MYLLLYIFDKLSAKYFSLGVCEMIVHFKTRVTFISRMLKKHKWYWTNSASSVILRDVHATGRECATSTLAENVGCKV